MLLILGLGSKKAFLLEDQNMEFQVCGFESSDEKECLELIFWTEGIRFINGLFNSSIWHVIIATSTLRPALLLYLGSGFTVGNSIQKMWVFVKKNLW